MRHPARNKILTAVAVSVVLTGLAQLLYGHGSRAHFENEAGMTTTSERSSGAACVRHSESDDPWSAEEVVETEVLAKSLSGAAKPIILQTGILRLYQLGHIPGSKYAGPAGTAEGLEKLKKLVEAMPRSSEIVYYCGCCPWKDCPNIRPVHTALREMGFKKIKVLNIPTNFSADWAAKGLPTEKGGPE
jgi:hypothetical protein